MSITLETAQEHANDMAVTCCRFEAGTVIEPANLEDPNILPDLEDSGLLSIPESCLTISQVLGAKLKETVDALTPLTPELLEGIKTSEFKEEVEQEKEDIAEVASVAPALSASGSVVKIHIGEGKDINLEIPLSVVGGVAGAPIEKPAQTSDATKAVDEVKEEVCEEKVVRTLTRKHFKIDKVQMGAETKIDGTTLTIREDILKDAVESEELVIDMKLDIITPDRYKEYSETIMDIQPIAVKEEGEVGEGITRVIDGTIIMVTGTDEDGVQIGEFGSSEGILDRNIMWGRPGSPEKGEIFIKTQVTIKAGTNMERPGPMAAHRATDIITQEIREALKKLDDSLVVNTEEFKHIRRPGKHKVVLVKEIMGQGAMHDNYILPVEPCGTLGAKPNVDLGNVPVVVSPLQVLDGCIHALTCIGPASKETSRHYWREPLVLEAMHDEELDLAGVIFVGSPQVNAEKFYVSKILGMTVEAMDVDGAIVTTEGFGNNHVDFASHIEQIGKRGIPVVGMTFSAVQGQLVVGNEYMDAMVDNNKSAQGIENEILENNCLAPEDAIRAVYMLKAKMAGEKIKKAERKWNPNVKLNNVDVIEQATGRKIELEQNEQSLEKSKKRREIYEVEE
ncbi:D-proline reductase (dithiol) proprotein PrdA [Crassaminicella indica]|uniref:D-proline reductase (Dithiol) proprotein PrdA n=1 Tax=Crassaminicella indica TaxID=2855394 RepID=A0ABX8R909_9CLOT|nr:D-proline reductase (dithiol) proprotein PrdA [Crassaminicella indica]QXM05535.1 D-proline reductase (dithiol) proprotein PrdA [Crassaminicella indica]